MRRRHSSTTVATVNGWLVRREQDSLGVTFHTLAVDRQGYQLRRSPPVPTRGEAERLARSFDPPTEQEVYGRPRRGHGRDPWP